MKWFNFNNNKEKKKNEKLTTDIMRVRVNRLINNSPVEVAVVDAQLIRDKSNNTIIFDEDNNLREELPGLYDSLVSDVLYKLESRGDSREQQLEKINNAIKKQEQRLKDEKEGYIGDGEEQEKVNVETEKTKLRLLKCIKYTVENKKGEGFFESIEIDGTRSLTYLIRDGDLIPYWHKTPTSEGEPVSLVPDVVQRKKFWKEATEETIQDFNESQDNMWKGILKVITQGLYVLFFMGLLVWTFYLIKWNGELYDEDLEPRIQQLQVENERIRQECSSHIAQQVENNDVLIKYATDRIEQELSNPPPINQPKNNIQI